MPAATVTTPSVAAITPTESVLEINAYATVPVAVASAVKIVCPSVFEFSAIGGAVITPFAPFEAVPGEVQALIAASAKYMVKSNFMYLVYL